MQNYNQNLPHSLSIQYTDTAHDYYPVKYNHITPVACIHCEKNIRDIIPEPIVVCGNCIKYIKNTYSSAPQNEEPVYNNSSALCAEDDYNESFANKLSDVLTSDSKLSPVGGNNTIPVSVLPVLTSDSDVKHDTYVINTDTYTIKLQLISKL
jgi:hypothetical protein